MHRLHQLEGLKTLRVALAQVNPTVGDLAGNAEKILSFVERARELGVDVIAFPELAVPGYPPEDLLLKPSFVEANLAAVHHIATETQGITAIVGFVDRDDDLYNAAAVLHDGQVAAVSRKIFLPTYAVFDEDRYFRTGEQPLVLSLGESMLGINICEDIWYPAGPAKAQALAGAQLVLTISASPYHAGKGAARERMLATRAADNVAYVAFCNMTGGQDELVFDGGSVIFDARGELVARGKQFAEDLVVADLDLSTVFRQRLHDPRRRKERAGQAAETVQRIRLAPTARQVERPAVAPRIEPHLELPAEVYQALVLGTRDYVLKNGFRKVVIGLSGGIDSALTAAVAADALGPENVTGVFMPSRYSSTESREDASQLGANLGIDLLTIAIDETFQAYLDILAEPFAGTEPAVTEENLQARIRGNILMALSNKFGWLVLTTGNKSEMSVGYATLYGDMAGGFAVIKDVPKMWVYEVAAHTNARAGREIIPQRVFDKAPTAELRPNQKDEDSLPRYDLLDPILHAYVEEDRGFEEIVALGFEAETVAEVLSMVDRAEYKRRQAPPGVRITQRALGKDRRLPITNRFRGG
ncbi:MAG TPA: NAD+ synthase [Anaerolineae bacterium]|nr:NAD+ synthase [Anaerolineae bacterium]